MRRTFVGRHLGSGAAPAREAITQQPQLRDGAIELAGKFEHGLVLFGRVTFEPGEAFFEAVNAFFVHWEEGFSRGPIARAARLRPRAKPRGRAKVFPARAE